MGDIWIEIFLYLKEWEKSKESLLVKVVFWVGHFRDFFRRVVQIEDFNLDRAKYGVSASSLQIKNPPQSPENLWYIWKKPHNLPILEKVQKKFIKIYEKIPKYSKIKDFKKID